MIVNDEYYKSYFPEVGVEFLNNSNSSFIIWEGYFYELFMHIVKAYDYSEYPIEIKDYNDLSGWKNGMLEGRAINCAYTIAIIEKILLKESKKDYRECYLALLRFLNDNILETVIIQEYL